MNPRLIVTLPPHVREELRRLATDAKCSEAEIVRRLISERSARSVEFVYDVLVPTDPSWSGKRVRMTLLD